MVVRLEVQTRLHVTAVTAVTAVAALRVTVHLAHDLDLPGSKGPTVPFLMYPQGENANGRFDSLDADSFRYRITSREIGV